MRNLCKFTLRLAAASVIALVPAGAAIADPPGMLTDAPFHRHFLVTPDGDFVFLEVNPVGQFLFVQELIPELDMIGAVADRLVEGCATGKVER